MTAIHTIAEASLALRQKRLTVVELLEQCLNRIDIWEDSIGAWVYLDREHARHQAQQKDMELKDGYCRGPLHGIPLGIKDIIDVQSIPTRAGSRVFPERPVSEITDAAVIERLRHAGAILLGKSVTTEFACFDPPKTRNPWNVGHTPGGSSSGSAAAVATGMCLGALGTQTGGSITRPASFCGVSSIKPTYGRVSVRGVVPVSFSLDHVGPMAKTVMDAATLLSVISGYDPIDPYNRPLPDLPLEFTPLSGEIRPRLGYLRGYFHDNSSSTMQKSMETMITRLQQAGAEIREISLPASFQDVHTMHRRVMLSEMLSYHQQFFPARELDYQPGIRSLLQEASTFSALDYADANRHRKFFTRDMRTLIKSVDAILTPATASSAPDYSTTGSPDFQSPWSYSGLPTVSFPIDISSAGLPLAVQLVGSSSQETELIQLALWCEKQIEFSASPSSS